MFVVSKRKHIGLKTRCASLIVQCGLIPYDDAKQMTETQILSLTQVDHNILHSSEHEDRDKFWNLTHTLIAAHRTKTKGDAKIIAKSKRIRHKGGIIKPLHFMITADGDLCVDHGKAGHGKIRSRGFDRTKTRGFNGVVRDRK